jgi:hypothetical protein
MWFELMDSTPLTTGIFARFFGGFSEGGVSGQGDLNSRLSRTTVGVPGLEPGISCTPCMRDANFAIPRQWGAMRNLSCYNPTAADKDFEKNCTFSPPKSGR